jgi:plasmid stabilization system protein ParE
MAEITWSKLALDDLDSIHDYIAKESPFYAQKTIEEFIERVLVLATHLEIGREVPEYVRKDVRELNEGNYRIFTKSTRITFQ